MREVQAVLVETVFTPHYAGDAMFAVSHETMKSFGLQFFDIGTPADPKRSGLLDGRVPRARMTTGKLNHPTNSHPLASRTHV